jgi:GNAT superfamily N-acetyltransferase
MSTPPSFTVRSAVESDREPLRRFFAELSPQTSFLRFFGGGFRATDAMLDVLLGARLPGSAFLAVHDGEIVGHAMWTPLRGRPGAADLGFVVTDAWQGRGVGSRLLDVTVADAQAAGTVRLELSMLAENRSGNRFVRRRWARSAWALVDGIVDYDVPLDEFAACVAA